MQFVTENLSVSVLLPVAEAWQSPGAVAAQASSVGTNAENPQEGQREKVEPESEKTAAPFPEVLYSSGKKRTLHLTKSVLEFSSLWNDVKISLQLWFHNNFRNVTHAPVEEGNIVNKRCQ